MYTDNNLQVRKTHWALLVVVFCCTFFVNNNALLSDIMESRNLITAREMVSENNWLIPTMNGELRLEKPPLPTWIAGIVESVTPDNIIAQRAMAGMAGCLLVVFFYLLACLLTGNATYALVSALILCTSYNLILMGRTATWDIYCHAFMMGAIYYLARAWCSSKYKAGWFLLAGLFLGLSFLGKGPVSFYALLLPFLCAYIGVYRPRMQGKWRGLAVLLIVCITVSAWWYLYIYMYHPEVASFVFKKEASNWTSYNVRPWYYYWNFFLETGVWSLLTITALLYPYWQTRVADKKGYLFSFLWTVLMLFFMSLLPEKKSRYLLPILIPSALMMGHLFIYWMQAGWHMQKKDKIIYYINTYLVAVCAVVLPAAVWYFVYRSGDISTGMLIGVSAMLLAVAGWLFVCAAKIRAYGFLFGVVVLFIVAELFLLPYLKVVVHNSDFKSISATREMEQLRPLPFHHPAEEMMRIEMVFEAYKKITPLDLNDPEAVMAATPFVLISQQPVETVLPAHIREQVIMEHVDWYDNNRWPKNHKRYVPVFINEVTIVKKK